MWHQIVICEETGYHNFPSVANRSRGGKLLSSPICYYDKAEKELRSKIRELVRAIWADNPMLMGNIEMVYFFGVKIPASWGKKKRQAALDGEIKPNVKPDLTNRLYWLENRMKGIVFGDDAMVVDLSAKARYVEVPYCEVYIRSS
jgi:Holliday junction resolvase RusA-like endonuclease